MSNTETDPNHTSSFQRFVREESSSLPGRTLRSRILFLVLLLGIGPSLITLAVTTTFAVNALRTNAMDQAQAIVNSQSEAAGRAIQEQVEELAELGASLLPVDGDWFSPLLERIDDSRINRRYGLASIDGIHMLNSDGVSSTEPLPAPLLRGMGQTDPAPFAFEWHGMDGLSVREFWIVVPLVSPTVREKQFWLVASEPYSNLVSLKLNSQELEGFLLFSSKSGPIGQFGQARELDAITNRRVELLESQGVYTVADSPEVVYIYSRAGAISQLSERTGMPTALLAMKRIDLGSVTAPLLYSIWQILLFFILFVVVYTFVGIWLSNRLVSPIMKLRDGFQRLENGDLDFRVKVNTGDELEDLSSSMNSMATTLQSTYKSLADKLLEINDQARQLGLSYEIAKAINRSLDLHPLLESIMMQLRQVVEVDQMALLLIKDNNQVQVAAIRPRMAWGFEAGYTFPLEGTLTEVVMEPGNDKLRLYQAGDKELDWLNSFGSDNLRDVGYLALLPLHSNTGPVGMLMLGLRKGSNTFTDQERENLELLAPTLANAMEHGRLYQKQAFFAEELERQVRQRTAELELAQQQLLQAEKLTTAGDMASNVAHEVNNPLSIIKNHINLIDAQIMRCRLDGESQVIVRDGLHIIGEEIDRIARIVHQLKQIGSPVETRWERFSLNEEVSTIVSLFRQTFYEKHLDVRIHLDDSLPETQLCRDYVKQILINLLRNAYDAVEPKGTITIETTTNGPDKTYVSVRVTDNGCGIPEDHRSRIFDPFYTTKKEGRGTGLGLSVSYGLAVKMKGQIEVRSAAGQGTTMTLRLPIAQSDETNLENESTVVRQIGGRIIIG